MIVKSTQLLAALASLSFCMGVAQANDMDPDSENYTALKTPVPIELDGDLSEWSGANVIDNPRFAIPKNTGWEEAPEIDRVTHEPWGSGTWDGPDDHSATIRVMYDDESVYLGIIVTDDYHEHAAAGGGGAWNGDSLQLIFTDAERTERVSLVNVALLGIEEDNPGEGNVPGEDNSESISIHNEAAAEGSEAFIVRDTLAKTTTYEVRFPVEVISFDLDVLAEGVEFGLGIDINDGDEDSPGQSGWSGWGPHALVVGGKTPFEAGLVTLGGVATPGGPPLIAHFPLDDNGNSADGAFEASTVTDVEFGSPGANGNTGSSATFNGASSVIQHDFNEALNPDGNFTLTLWAKSNGGAGAWNSPVTSRHDLNAEGETSQGYLIYDSAPTGQWTFWSGNGEDPGNWQVLDGPEVNVGEWEHVAISYDDDEELKLLYINGELFVEDENSIAPNDTTPFNIGAGQDFGDGFWFDGEIDDIGLFGALLTEDQIIQVMEEGVASLTGGGAPVGPIFAPGDAIIGGQISEDGTMFDVGVEGTEGDINNWPGGEAPEFAIDGVGQKYLNFGKFNTGVLVTPAAGSTVANQIQLWAANDSEPRDPASFEVYGTNEEVDGEGPFATSDFQLITSGELELPSTRNAGGDAELLDETSQSLIFSNSTAYTSYLVVFPTIKDEVGANSMQIAEIQLANIGDVNLLVVTRVKSAPTGLTFEVINQGDSVVDKESIAVTADGVAVATTVTDIEGGVLVSYAADPEWLPGSTHTYDIVVKDTNGNNANRSGAGETTLKDGFLPYLTPLPGPDTIPGMWTVRYVFDAGTIGGLNAAVDAIQAAAEPDFDGQVVDVAQQFMDEGTGGGGIFTEAEVEYPDAVIDNAAWTGEDFVVFGRAFINITDPGTYTFGVHTDDGFAYRIFGAAFSAENGGGQLDPVSPDTIAFPAPTGNSDTRGIVELSAGTYEVEFVWYERGGGDGGELYAAKGEFVADEDTDTWALVGHPDGIQLGGPGALPFQITDIVKAGTDVSITWQSTEGAGYTIERASPEQLATGDFEELQDGYEGQDGTTTFTDSDVTDDEAYYRVKAE